MPGNLAPATAVSVLPQTLCTAFQRAREYPALTVGYHDATTERSLVALIDGDVNPPASIRTWKLSKRLAAADLAALRNFFEGVGGTAGRFYYYDPFDVLPGQRVGSNWDGTGANTTGRYKAMFQMPQWSETVDLARSATELIIAQVA